MYKRFVRYLRASILVGLLLSPDLQTFGQKAPAPSFVSNNPGPGVNSAKAPFIVIGFVGGLVRHDDTVHSPVQLAMRIRKDYPSSVYVEVFENRRREQAHQAILKLLDAKRAGAPSEEDKGNARIIIYGMSWGGSETVALARELGAEKIPVVLTIQVDSVQKTHENDEIIPANVGEAVNFYESDGFVHGRSEIRAEDASCTKILGNFRFSYSSMPPDCANYPWWDRWFVKPHTEIECDPAVWKRVESLIRSKLPPAGEGEIPQR